MSLGPLSDLPLSAGWWCGCAWATQQDFEDIWAIYGNHSLSSYKFTVENNLRHVEVTSYSRAACGIWTLANMKVRYDLTPRQVAGMAAKMRRAVEVFEDSCR